MTHDGTLRPDPSHDLAAHPTSHKSVLGILGRTSEEKAKERAELVDRLGDFKPRLLSAADLPQRTMQSDHLPTYKSETPRDYVADWTKEPAKAGSLRKYQWTLSMLLINVLFGWLVFK